MKLPSQRRAFQEQEEQSVEVGKHLPALKNLVQHDWGMIQVSGSGWRGESGSCGSGVDFILRHSEKWRARQGAVPYERHAAVMWRCVQCWGATVL